MTLLTSQLPERPASREGGPDVQGHRARPAGRGIAPRLAPYGFVAPAVILFALLILVPVGYTIYLSFFQSKVSGLGLGAGARRQVFAGLSNYASALTDHPFLSSLGRVALYSVILVPVMMGLALLFALLLDARRVRFQRFSRLAIFLPYAVPTVIGALLWGFMYLPTVSPFTVILHHLGLGMPDLFGTRLVLFSVANVGVWGGTGFNMIVLYTALRSVPSELYQAARIDGASQWQIALRVKIPMIGPALLLTVVFSMIATLQVFNEPATLAPLSNTISPDWVTLMRIQDLAFTTNDSYEAAAMSVVVVAAIFVLSYGVLRFSSRRVFQGRL
jgi:multiple sugar transport system permease protein